MDTAEAPDWMDVFFFLFFFYFCTTLDELICHQRSKVTGVLMPGNLDWPLLKPCIKKFLGIKKFQRGGFRSCPGAQRLAQEHLGT